MSVSLLERNRNNRFLPQIEALEDRISLAVDAFLGHGGFVQSQQSDGPASATLGSATAGAGAGKIKVAAG